MSRILVLHPLPPGGDDPLTEAEHEVVTLRTEGSAGADRLASLLPDFDGLVSLLTDRIGRDELAAGAAGRLRVVGNVAVGYDNVDIAAAEELGIAVCNTPGVLDDTTADLAFLLILAAARRSSEAEASLRADGWPGWDLLGYLGQDVHGATLGLVGYGRIARRVAVRAAGFAMTVLHHARSDTGVSGYVADLHDLLRQADVVSIHVPLTDATRHLIGPAELALMKPSAVLVNTSRGPVVDERALAEALHAGTIWGAGLDVYEDEPAVAAELLSAPHAVLLPHIGSASIQTRTKMAQLACRGVCEVLAGRSPPNRVTV